MVLRPRQQSESERSLKQFASAEHDAVGQWRTNKKPPFPRAFVCTLLRSLDQAAGLERIASTRGRYFLLSSIQWAARPFASASLASGKVTNGTRVGPTLQ